MEITCPQNEVPHIKVFAPPTKHTMRRIYSYVEPPMYGELVEVAQYEGLEISATIRELLGLALRYYKFKRGTLNPTLPQNSKTFYCQVCSQLTSMRKLHSVAIMYEEYKFCEDCFFKDKYKSFVTTMINRA